MKTTPIRTIPLQAYPGWVVRSYASGYYDAAQVNGPGLSPGLDSFQEAVSWVKAQLVAPSAYALAQERLKVLSVDLSVTLTLGYIGNVYGNGQGADDDRSWDVCIGQAVPRAHTEGRGPWSHRASGSSYPCTPSWRTADFPTPDALEAMIRTRLAREEQAAS